MQQTTQVQQYRSELTLSPEVTGQKEATISLTTPDAQTARQIITRLLGEDTVFNQQKNDSLFIYHPGILHGKEPCGWMAPIQVPNGLDVKTATSVRLGPQRVAA